MLSKIAGYKTYIMAGGMALFAVLGLVLNQIEPGEVWKLLLEAGAIAGLRNAIK